MSSPPAFLISLPLVYRQSTAAFVTLHVRRPPQLQPCFPHRCRLRMCTEPSPPTETKLPGTAPQASRTSTNESTSTQKEPKIDSSNPPFDGSSGDDGTGRKPDDNNEGDDAQPSQPAASYVGSDRVRDVQEALTGKLKGIGRLTGTAWDQVAGYFGQILHVVPPPVLVALISLVSTITGTQYKAKLDKVAAQRAEEERARKKRDEIERNLRKVYADLAAPILKSAAKLAERLQVLVDSEWDRVETVDASESLTSVYSAYLLGRYLATVEIIKRESTLMDYGFPAGDRILSNILGRIQGVLCANDELLIEMQKVEHLFQPPKGEKALKGGPLRITPRAQTVLGELLMRKKWRGKFDYVEEVGEDELKSGPKATISFLEFSRIIKDDDTMRHWYSTIVDEFDKLEGTVKQLPRHKRKCEEIGSRVYFLQSALLDLVEFFDPLPHAQSVPYYRRRRLQLGKLKHSEEQRAPMSLHLLYHELANVRDHLVLGGNARDRLQLPGGQVEVYVKASPSVNTGDSTVEITKHGDCPYSQRVLIVLEELGIPYRTVFISSSAKPAWFYLLHPENRTPVVYHDGNLVEESRHIVAYLMERFRWTGKELGSAEKLRLSVGTPVFTRFHDRFLNWMSGEEGEKAEVERELRRLDSVIAHAQAENEGLPFLGGERFSREDTAIVPMLNNVQVAGRALKKWEMPSDCKALRTYLEAARQEASFAKTVGDDEAIVAGYGQLGIKGERTWRLADMLE